MKVTSNINSSSFKSSNIETTNALLSNDKKRLNNDKAKNLIGYSATGVITAILGSLHGVYKKVNKDQISTIEDASSFHDKFILDKPKIRIRMAQLKPTGHDGAFSIISDFPPRKGPAMAMKVLIDNMVNLEDSFKYQNEWMILFQKGLMKLGFNPKSGKIVEFVSSYDADVLNKKLKEITGFDFHIELEPRKGRCNGHNIRIVDTYEVLPPELLNKPFESNFPTKIAKSKKHISFFKKILNPFDEKVFSIVEKIPLGKKFTNFMRRTNSPIKQFSLFRTKFYDSTSMLKGAGSAAIVGLGLFSLAKYFISKYNQNKKTFLK